MNNTSLDDQSLHLLATQAPQHLTWIICSALAIISNVFVAITIIVSKQLHNKSQYIILSQTIAEITYSSAYFGTGLARFLAYALNKPETSNQLICILKQLPLHCTSEASTIFLLALAFDRILCLAAPVFHKKLDPKRYILTMNVVNWGFTLSKVPLMFINLDKTKVFPVCIFAVAFDPSFVSYHSYYSNVLTSLTVLIYTLVAAMMLRKYKKATFSERSTKSEWKKQMEFDVFMAVSLIGTIYLLSRGIATAISTVSLKYVGTELENAIIFSTIVSILNFITLISHLFVYMKVNIVFREEFFRIVCRKNNSVGPLFHA
jgi:hypothetical protein